MRDAARFLCIMIPLLLLANMSGFAGLPEDDAKVAEDWVRAEEKYDSPEKKFECLEMALRFYSTRSPKSFNWRHILTELDSLHKECGLKIKEDSFVNYCCQRNTDALDFLDQCMTLDLILYNKYNNSYDSSLLQHLLKTIVKEQQNNNEDYVNKAISLMIKAIKSGADFRPFYSINNPSVISELIDNILKMDNFEAFKAIVDYKAVPHYILTLETTKHQILKCSNERIVQYYKNLLINNSQSTCE